MPITRATKPQAEKVQPAETPKIKRLDLLYVEDEDLNWEVTLLHLSERYNVDRAKTDEEAFAAVKKKNYHAILMDIQLHGSGLNGIEITQILRGRFTGKIPEIASAVTVTQVPVIFGSLQKV
jgi:CheY-like chemotaxis protein